jgi:hypothetical protein
MTKTFIGIKSGVGPVVKVLRNDADNPLTVPTSDFAKFNFDSEQTRYATLREVRSVATRPATDPDAEITIADLGYAPIVSVYVRLPTGEIADQGWMQGSVGNFYSRFFPRVSRTLVRVVTYFTFPAGSQYIIAIWNLPADGQAATFRTTAAITSGLRMVEFSTTRCAVAAPGFDVRTATAAQTILSATVNPAECITAGAVTVSSSAPANVTIDNPFEGDVFVDMQWNNLSSSEMRVPYFLNGRFDANIAYTRSGNVLTFSTTVSSSITIRYFVLALNLAGRTSGTYGGLRTITYGGKRRLQIIAPGSSSTPNINDCIFDSEWMSIPIVAAGNRVNDTGGLANPTFPINWNGTFQNLGYIPFVKFSNYVNAGDGRYAVGNGDYRPYTNGPGVIVYTQMSAISLSAGGFTQAANFANAGGSTINPPIANFYQFATP